MKALIISNAIQIFSGNIQNFYTSFGRQDNLHLTQFAVMLAVKQLSDNDEFNNFKRLNLKSNQSLDLSQIKEDEEVKIDELQNNMNSNNIHGKYAGDSGKNDPEDNNDSEKITTNKADCSSDCDENSVPVDLESITVNVDDSDHISSEVSDYSDDSYEDCLSFIPFDTFSNIRRISEDSADCEYSDILEDLSVISSDQNEISSIGCNGCTSAHEGHQLVHTILPLNIEVLFNMLFSKSEFFVDFHQTEKSFGLECGEWLPNEDGTKTRTIDYNISLSKLFGVKSSKVSIFLSNYLKNSLY